MIGFCAAITAVCFWTFACSIWRRESEQLLPRQINIYKNVVASIFFFPAVLTISWFSDLRSIFVLMISGIVGIAIGDTLYIHALKIIGVRKTLSFEALTPIIATILGNLIINEIYPNKVWIGSFIVSFSLLMILSQNTCQKDHAKEIKIIGILYALGSVFCAVFAALMSRMILITSTLTPFEATEIRLLSSSICLLLFFKKDFIDLLNKRSITIENHKNLFVSTLLGTNFCILFQQIVFKALPIGMGWTLLSFSPVVSLFFSHRERERINKLTVIYTLLSIIGVGIVLI